MPDIAYHLDKLQRGYTQLVDLLGADHHGYIARMKAALMAFGYPKETLDIDILQMVRLIENGVDKNNIKALILCKTADFVEL